MNRIVIIGNGFDLAHGLKTSYKDFIYWYWKQRLEHLVSGHPNENKDGLCTLRLDSKSDFNRFGNLVYLHHDFFQQTGEEFFKLIKVGDSPIVYEPCPFMKRICSSIETKGWVDIEKEYYEELTKTISPIPPDYHSPFTNQCTNVCLELLRHKFITYLKEATSEETKSKDNLLKGITDKIYKQDISKNDEHRIREYMISTNEKDWKPRKIMLLDFNYTDTTELYAEDDRVIINHIHGSLENPESIIFGYGDELDHYNEKMQYGEYREYLKHAKSLNYMESSAYQDMLSFANEAEFQILIMGHSCGLSDRTLLNTLFEHRNCISIKPYIYRYQQENTITHQIEDKDNFTDLIQDIYRNFKDKALFRSRVMNKTRCGWM